MTKQFKHNFSAKEKNKNLMKLFTTSQSFQKEVEAFRKLFKVPKKDVSEKEYSKWLSWIYNDMELNEQSGAHMPKYITALNNLVRGHNLPENFFKHVREYIETGEISYPLNNFSVTPSWPNSQSVNVSTHVKLSQKEEKDLLEEMKHMGKHLPKISSIRNLDGMLQSEKLYKECEDYNNSDNKEYDLTVKELLSTGKTKAKKVYEDKRMLDDYRKKQFGKN